MTKEEIIRLRGTGLSYGAIAIQAGLSRARIHQICSGYRTPSIQTKEEKALRIKIIKRDKYRCQWKLLCEGKKLPIIDLVVHHIDFNSTNNDPENQVTLCKRCHGGYHGWVLNQQRKAQGYVAPHANRICKGCKKEFYLKGHPCKVYCSNECLLKYRPRLTLEERKRRQRIAVDRVRTRWLADPILRARLREQGNRAVKKYYKNHRDEVNARFRKRYWKNVEESRRKAREYWYNVGKFRPQKPRTLAQKKRANERRKQYYWKKKLLTLGK